MFEFLKKKPEKDKEELDLDMLAEFLGSSRGALEAFEKEYRKSLIRSESDNFYDHSVKEMSQEVRTTSVDDFDKRYLSEIVERIVDELVSETSGFRVKDGKVTALLPSKTDIIPVMMDELKKVPEPLRPMLTGSFYKRDISRDNYKDLLWALKKSMEETDPAKKKAFYGHFRIGLDTLDLDPVIYEMLSMNRNSIGNWLPAIAGACAREGFFKIPDTVVVRVPLPVLQLTRLDYTSINLTTLKIVDEWAMRVFGLDVSREYFIKTGIFSSKFDFRNARVKGEKEVRELGEYLLFIQNQATMYASYLNTDMNGKSLAIYGAATTDQFAVRDFIADKEDNPCIYNGMPLHTEYRVFAEFGKNARILGISPYWRPDVMKKRLGNAASNKDRHDYVIYRMHEEKLMKRYEKNKDKVLSHIRGLLPYADLEGQWSIDVMQNGDEFYLIDMATADTSALNDCVSPSLLKKSPERWLPEGLPFE